MATITDCKKELIRDDFKLEAFTYTKPGVPMCIALKAGPVDTPDEYMLLMDCIYSEFVDMICMLSTHTLKNYEAGFVARFVDIVKDKQFLLEVLLGPKSIPAEQFASSAGDRGGVLSINGHDIADVSSVMILVNVKYNPGAVKFQVVLNVIVRDKNGGMLCSDASCADVNYITDAGSR